MNFSYTPLKEPGEPQWVYEIVWGIPRFYGRIQKLPATSMYHAQTLAQFRSAPQEWHGVYPTRESAASSLRGGKP